VVCVTTIGLEPVSHRVWWRRAVPSFLHLPAAKICPYATVYVVVVVMRLSQKAPKAPSLQRDRDSGKAAS